MLVHWRPSIWHTWITAYHTLTRIETLAPDQASIGAASPMATPESKPIRDDTRDQLKSAQEECERLRDENERLRAMLGIPVSGVASQPEGSTTHLGKSGGDLATPAGKIALFRSLFRAREDVYAVRWEGKGGKSGYSPAAAMDWRAINAARPEERKGIARKTRMLLPLTTEVIR